MEVRLLTANMVAHLGPAARPVLPAMPSAIAAYYPQGKGDRLREYPSEILRQGR